MFSRFTRYFDEVARAGSIRRASERLRIAPSAIDRQILQMEEELGVPLFERSPQGLRLTAAGEVLVEAVRRWRRDYNRVKSQIDQLRGLRSGEITVALAEGALEFVIPSIALFRSQYPGIVCNLNITAEVTDTVLRGDAEIGVTFKAQPSHLLKVEQTMVEKVDVIVPAKHPLANRTCVELHDCLAYPLIIAAEIHPLRKTFERLWSKAVGGGERFAISANSVELMKELVCQGLGITFLTRIAVESEIEAGQLVCVPLANEEATSTVSLLRAAGRQLSIPAMMLVKNISDAMAERPDPEVAAPSLPERALKIA